MDVYGKTVRIICLALRRFAITVTEPHSSWMLMAKLSGAKALDNYCNRASFFMDAYGKTVSCVLIIQY